MIGTRMELYRKFRPKKLEQVVGHDAVINVLERQVCNRSVPHAIMLAGPSGVGKTTIGRILRRHVGCHPNDFVEMNCAKYRGIDNVRPIEIQAHQAPLAGGAKMWLMDECHMLTKEAANCLLKILEDTPSHTYFVLATTDEQKVLKTIRTRCSRHVLSPLADGDLELIVGKVAEQAGITVPSEVMREIIANSDGSGRTAVVLLDQIRSIDSEREMLQIVRQSSEQRRNAYELCKLLLWRRSGWSKVVGMLKMLEHEDPEQMRRLVLACAKTAMLGTNEVVAKRGFIVADAFRDNYFDCGMSGLVASCYQVYFGDQ